MSRSATFATACVLGLMTCFGPLHASGQGKPESFALPEGHPPMTKEEIEEMGRDADLEAAIDKKFEEYDLTPQPLPEIPDNPPPHEGAMIDHRDYRIEPPDLVLIEVLEALPGRPITGERLVRPDGTITLGFYGDLHVRGLTVEQLRVKLLKHLRRYLSDEVLGLYEEVPIPKAPENAPTGPSEIEKLLDRLKQELERSEGLRKELGKDQERPQGISIPKATTSSRRRVRSVSDSRPARPVDRWRPRNAAGLYFARSPQRPESDEEDSRPREDDEQVKADAEPGKTIEIPLEGDSRYRLEIKIRKKTSPVESSRRFDPDRLPVTEPPGDAEASPFDLNKVPMPPGMEETAKPALPDSPESQPLPSAAEEEAAWVKRPLPPHTSDRVFVDITAFNSTNYYILGDVQMPGKLPNTGNETVLDALQYAGGLLSSGDPRNIRLVRPGRNGKPSKVYKVDLEAIQERGETATNYQMFPNDRLIVGRDEVVKTTVQIDRVSTALQEVTSSISQASQMARSVKAAAPDEPDVLLKGLVEFWIKELSRPDGAVFNEETLRDALLRRLPVKPDAPKPAK